MTNNDNRRDRQNLVREVLDRQTETTTTTEIVRRSYWIFAAVVLAGIALVIWGAI